MLRSIAALLVAALALPALAQQPPVVRGEPVKDAPKAPPVVGVSLMTVTAQDGGVTMDKTEYTQQAVDVPYTYVQDGKQVTGTRKETMVVPVTTRTVVKFKDMKATGTDGKAMAADALEKSLKDGGVVVMHYGKLDPDFRKVFKDGTVFLEQQPPVMVMPAKPEKESK